ncbi:MAG: hypothetical protein EBZ61_10255 [Micrococcales bacterium]|nr:hypothetical protein [Micrococcales bacterium]
MLELTLMTQMLFFFGVLTKREFDQANQDLFLIPTLGATMALVGYYVVPALMRLLKEYRTNQKIKEREFLEQRAKTVSELHRLESIGEFYTVFLAGGSKWSDKFENSPLGKASLNEIRAGLLLDVRKSLDRDLTPGNRRKLLKALRGAWDSIPFFGILKSEGKIRGIEDSMPIIDSQNILEAFIALCEPSLKFGGPDWEAVYQKIVVPLLGGLSKPN